MTFKITCKSRKAVHDLLELGAAFLKLKIVPPQHFLCDSRMEKIMLWANTLLRIWYTLYVYGTKIQFGRESLTLRMAGSTLLMINEINHIWTAEMKWRWRNDRRSERNLCNCVKKPEKNSGIQVLHFFFQASLRNCINCVHCEDHFFIFRKYFGVFRYLNSWFGN